MLPGPEPVPPAADEDWSALKDAVRRFEAAWRQGPRPAVEAFLPADDRQCHAVLIELVHIDLELRLKSGEAVRVEEYLGRYPELAADRAAAADLIAAEFALRRRGERHLTTDDYLRRFPQYQDGLPARLGPATVAGSGLGR